MFPQPFQYLAAKDLNCVLQFFMLAWFAFGILALFLVLLAGCFKIFRRMRFRTYFVPQSHGTGAGVAKWIFPGSGFMMACLRLVVAFSRFKRFSAESGQLAALMKARADMGKKDQ